jgi:hypothetical protein
LALAQLLVTSAPVMVLQHKSQVFECPVAEPEDKYARGQIDQPDRLNKTAEHGKDESDAEYDG